MRRPVRSGRCAFRDGCERFESWFAGCNTATLDAPGDTDPSNNKDTEETTVPGGNDGGGDGGNGVTPVPTLGEWSLMLLGLLAAGLGAGRLRRGR